MEKRGETSSSKVVVYPRYSIDSFLENVRLQVKFSPKSILTGIDWHLKSSLKHENISNAIKALGDVLSNVQEMKKELGVNTLDKYVEGIISEVSSEGTDMLTYLKAQRVIDDSISNNIIRWDENQEKKFARDLLTYHSIETAVLGVLASVEINRQYLQKTGDWVYNRDDIKKIVKSCLLHDIGKIATDMVDLWTFAGKLEPEQRNRMRLHTLYGRKILEQSNESIDEEIKNAVEDHHEKWDGSGYNGKKGNEISPMAAFVGAVDKFDAMNLARRKYRMNPVANFWNAYLAEIYGYSEEKDTSVIHVPKEFPQDNFGRVYYAFYRLFNNAFNEPDKDFYKIKVRIEN